jgi:hypothetical protein
MNRLILAACALTMSVSATSADAKLDGAYRSQYVSSGQKACLEAAGPVDAGRDRARLSAFCRCKMNYIADHVTEAQLTASHKLVQAGGSQQAVDLSTSLARLIEAGSAYCAASSGK